MLQFVIEIVLAPAVFCASSLFWQFRKRRRFVGTVGRSPVALEKFITREMLSNPPPLVQQFAQKNKQLGYALTLQSYLKADISTHLKMTLVFGLIVVAMLCGSYYLGVPYLIINGVLFVLTSFFPIIERMAVDAMEFHYTIAVILHNWRLEDRTEYEQLMSRTMNFRLICDAVEKAQAS